MAGVAWLSGEREKARDIADRAVKKLALIPDGSSRTTAAWLAATFFGFHGMEPWVREFAPRLSPLRAASGLALLARRRAYECDFEVARKLLGEVVPVLAANDQGSAAVRIRTHQAVASVYYLFSEYAEASRHALAARDILDSLPSHTQDQGRPFIVAAFVGAGLFEEAEQEIEKIGRPSKRVFAYAMLADGLSFFRKNVDATRALRTAEHLIEKIGDQDVRERYQTLLNAARLRLGLGLEFDDLRDPDH